MIAIDSLNERLLEAEYAVRGPVVIRAQQLEEQGKKIIYCNIGNPQALKQKPLTFLRQMLSLLEYPDLLNRPEVVNHYPGDVVDRARQILQRHPHGTGAYTQSTGIPFIRQAVADFIQKRDGIPASRDRIILTDGASKGAQAVLTALLKNDNDGFMIPIPQYPLYSASLTLYGGKQIGYFLDENNSWQLSEVILAESIAKARKDGINPYARGEASAKDALQKSMRGLIDLYPSHIWKEDYLLFPMTNKVLNPEDQKDLRAKFEMVEEAIGREVHHRLEHIAEEIERKTLTP